MEYYPSNIGTVTKLILPIRINKVLVDNLDVQSKNENIVQSHDNIVKVNQELTKEQFIALQRMSKNDTFLLHDIICISINKL